jgi:hypothetical protein
MQFQSPSNTSSTDADACNITQHIAHDNKGLQTIDLTLQDYIGLGLSYIEKAKL